jgi:hypothetical protein
MRYVDGVDDYQFVTGNPLIHTDPMGFDIGLWPKTGGDSLDPYNPYHQEGGYNPNPGPYQPPPPTPPQPGGDTGSGGQGDGSSCPLPPSKVKPLPATQPARPTTAPGDGSDDESHRMWRKRIQEMIAAHKKDDDLTKALVRNGVMEIAPLPTWSQKGARESNKKYPENPSMPVDPKYWNPNHPDEPLSDDPNAPECPPYMRLQEGGVRHGGYPRSPNPGGPSRA